MQNSMIESDLKFLEIALQSGAFVITDKWRH